MLSIEELSSKELQQAQSILALVAAEKGDWGALAGVQRGYGPWDIRPATLSKGELSVVRVVPCPPNLHEDLKALLTVARRQHALSTSSWGVGELDSGLQVLWYRRTHFQHLLSQPFSSTPALRELSDPTAALRCLRSLVDHLRALHAQGLAHGHLVAENVAFDRGKAVLLDHGLALAIMRQQREAALRERIGFAPELARQRSLEGLDLQRCDSYGLGLLAQVLLPTEAARENLNRAQRSLLEGLLEIDPGARPSIEEVAQTLLLSLPSPVHGATAQVSPTQGSSANYSSAIPVVTVRRETVARQSGAGSVPQPVFVAPVSSKHFSVIALCVVGVLVILGARAVWSWYSTEPVVQVSSDDYAGLWSSAQPSSMEPVARAALDGDMLARSIIIGDAMSGQDRPAVRSRLLRLAFDQAWEQHLTEQDRHAALMLALSGLVQSYDSDLPEIAELHPGIIFSIAADLPLEGSGQVLAGVPVTTLSGLPAPLGTTFTGLAAIHERDADFDMSSIDARTLAHLITGDSAPEVMERWCGTEIDANVVTANMLLLTRLASLPESIWERAFATLATRGDKIADRAIWFTEEPIAKWEEISGRTRVELMLGLQPGVALEFEPSLDLLKFPLTVVRRDAIERLFAGPLSAYAKDPQWRAVIELLASNDSQLTRGQVLALVAFLMLKGEAGTPYVNKWFSTEPDPSSVAALLSERGAVTAKLDPFTARAVNYLKDRKWTISDARLAKMAQNQEPLVRVLAYSSLDPAIPAQREILAKRLTVEPVARLKGEISHKLAALEE